MALKEETQVAEDKLLPAREAAAAIGVGTDALREWVQPDMLAAWFETPRAGSSAPRRYTPQDIELGRWVKTKRDEGWTYPQIRRRLEERGLEACLAEMNGIEHQMAQLKSERDRLQAELARLYGDNGRLQQVERSWNQARAITYMVLERLEAKRSAGERDLEILTVMELKARRNIDSAMEQVAQTTFWAWLFGGRRILLRQLAQAQADYAELAGRIQGMSETISALGDVSSLRAPMQLEIGAPKDVVALLASAAEQEVPPG